MMHLLFNASLYLTGFLFLSLGFSLPVYCRHFMAFLAGVALWGIISTFYLIVSIPLTLINILLFFALLLSLTIWNRRKEIFKSDRSYKKELLWFGLFFSVFILLHIAVSNYNLTFVSFDSWRYIGIGQAIGKSGYFPPPGFQAWDYFLSARMAILAVLYAISYLYHIELPYTLMPLTAIYFLLTFLALFFIATESTRLAPRLRLLLGICGVLLMATLPAYWFHAYFVNQNLLTSVYFTCSLMSLFIYRHQRRLLWLIIAAVSLSVTTLMRNEMSFFASIPLLMLLSMEGLEKKEYKIFLLIFISISFPWRVFNVYLLGLDHLVHDWGVLQIGVYVIYLLSYFMIHFKITRDHLAPLTPAITIGILTTLIFGLMSFSTIKPTEGMFASINSVFLIMFKSSGKYEDWRLIWFVILFFLVINALFIKEKQIHFWKDVLVIFILLRLILYSIGLFSIEAAASMFNSGSRILMHLMPSGICYVMLSLGYFLSDLIDSGRRHLKSGSGGIGIS